MLKQFKCTACGSVDMLTGGTCGHVCNPCKVSKGVMPGRTPQEEAHYLVSTAVRRGVLMRPSAFDCADCAAPATEYDHRDYSKPLDVDAVCRLCNRRRGPAANHPGTRRHLKAA